MSQNNTISVKAKNIVDNFINEIWSGNSISKTDKMKHIIITLYALMPGAKAELLEPFKDCIFDLHEYFTQDEIDVIRDESRAVIMYCYEFSEVMHGHISLDDNGDLIEEILVDDPPYSIYKTPKSLVDLCMRLSGKPDKGDNVCILYGDVSDYALYNPSAEFHIECEGWSSENGKIVSPGHDINGYSQILLDSQGVSFEERYNDGSDLPNYLSDYVFAFNPTLTQKRPFNEALSYCDGMWSNAVKVSSLELVKKIMIATMFTNSGKCLDFILPSDYLHDKTFWDYFKLMFQEDQEGKDYLKFNATLISLPSMDWGETYIDTFLLHIEKNKGNIGMIRLVDATAPKFYQKGGFTKEGEKALFEPDGNKDNFSITNSVHYKTASLNVDLLMEVINNKEEECMHYTKFFAINKHVPHQYLIDKKLPDLQEGEKYIVLKELIDVANFKRIEEGELPLLDTSLLSDKYMDCIINPSNIVTKEIGKEPKLWSDSPSYFTTEEPCLVAGIDGNHLKVGKLNDIEQPIAFKDGIIPFRVKKGLVTEDHLLRELAKEYCTTQALMLSDRDHNILDPECFLEIKIAVPSMKEQERRCKEDIQKSLEETRKYLKEADRQLLQSAEEFKRDVHMKKHAIGQTLFNLNNWWDLLQKARKEGNGIVNESHEVGKFRKTKVVDIYSNIQMALEKLQMQVDSFWRADGLQVESMSLTTFVKEYIKEHQSPLFVYEYDSVSTLVNNNVPKVAFSKQALTMVFDNIINNACSHGFENKASESNIVKIEIQMDNGLPYIVISNNGNPVHEKISSEDVFTYGRSSKSGQAHYGIGGYEVRNLMREFQGEAEFISTPQEDFPVSYKLSFKEVSNNV